MSDGLPKRLRPQAPARTRVGSPRDIAVVSDLAVCGVLRTGQIERLHFPSRRRAQRRLRAYLDHGLVRAHLQWEAMHYDNIWTLTRQGLEFLRDRGTGLEGVRPCRLNTRSQKLAHALLAREISVSILAAERRGSLVLRDLRHDAELANEPAFTAASLVPDGFALLEISGDVRPVVWEASSQKQPFGQVEAKLLAYERAITAGLPLFRDPGLVILFVLESRLRRDRLGEVSERLRLRDQVHVLLVEEAGDVERVLACLTPESTRFRRANPAGVR